MLFCGLGLKVKPDLHDAQRFHSEVHRYHFVTHSTQNVYQNLCTGRKLVAISFLKCFAVNL